MDEIDTSTLELIKNLETNTNDMFQNIMTL